MLNSISNAFIIHLKKDHNNVTDSILKLGYEIIVLLKNGNANAISDSGELFTLALSRCKKVRK